VAWVEDLHTYSSDLAMILVVVHVLGVLTMCVLQRENLVRAMITGRKRDRGD
jgi:cytochrome b